ncbi:MAG: hypothetical protein EOM12_09120 [Verrucomicrobiae bacterium]|nr:hypothetical protein [Verrucomicrobiae bacterium]
MNELRFIAALHCATSAGRKIICEKIKNVILKKGLNDLFPFIKYEKGDKGQYYLALAVNFAFVTDGVDFKEKSREVFLTVGLNNIIDETFLNDNWLKENYDCCRFAKCLRYEAAKSYDVSDFQDIVFDDEKSNDLNGQDEYEKLMYWCSAVGSGNFGRFQEVCRLIAISDRGGWSILRRFTLLGHLEFDAKFRWGVIPPALFLTANGRECVLAGQRTPNFINEIKEKCGIIEKPQKQGPSRLAFPFEKKGSCFEANSFRDVGCVSLEMARLLPDLKEWEGLLRKNEWEVDSLAQYQLSKYDPNKDKLTCIAHPTGEAFEGMYRFIFNQPYKRSVYAYFNGGSRRGVTGDFYGMRFLARSKIGFFSVFYNKKEEQLIIDERERWPMPYERALVLASGLLPHVVSAGSSRVLIYAGVTHQLASQLCDLLSLKMEEC